MLHVYIGLKEVLRLYHLKTILLIHTALRLESEMSLIVMQPFKKRTEFFAPGADFYAWSSQN
jgi:hypothetical protein